MKRIAREKLRKGLALFVSIAMAIGMFPTYSIIVRAEAANYAFEDGTYTVDGDKKIYEINKDSAVKDFGNITIPADCQFVISGATVTATSVTIASGGQLTIMNFVDNETDPGNPVTYDGTFTVPTVTASAGAHLFLGNKNNKPSGVDSLHDITAGDANITNDSEWGWFDFEYHTDPGDPGFIGWGYVASDPGPGESYSVIIDGYDSEAATITYSVSTDSGSTYNTPVTATNIEVNQDNATVQIENISEGLGSPVTNIKINISIKPGSNKKIYYAYRGADWSEVKADELSSNYQRYGASSYEVVFDNTLDMEATGYVWHEVHVALNKYRQGKQETADLISNYLYAYSDLNGNSSVDDTDMKIGLATELCSRFFWDDGGIVDGGTFDIYKPQDLYDPSDVPASRINISTATAITAKDNSNGNQTIDHYTYSINLGVSEAGVPVTVSGDVYAVPNDGDILIWTGTEWFVRNKNNLTDFYVDNNDDSKDDKAVCVKAAFTPSAVKIGGNGCSQGAETINPEGDDVYCIGLNNKMFNSSQPSGGRFADYFNRYYTSYTALAGLSCKLRLVNPGKTYVVVNSEGESNAVYGINSEQVDRISETGASSEKKSTDVFVGATAIHIEAVNAAIADTVHITNVALKDSSMSDGVVITNPGTDDFKVEFKSNFYDTVPLLITYSDSSVKELTVNRVGLVITAMYLNDSMSTFNFMHGGVAGSESCSYDYAHGQTVIVYATYYHPSTDPTGGSNNLSLYVTNADGSTRVINKTAYTRAAGGSVAMTDFVIAFRQGSAKLGENPDGTYIYGDKIDPSMQAMSAIVLNGGYNDADSFGGTQVGAGKGVYWDGHIEWNY